MTRFSESLRQLVHIAVGGAAFLLRWLSWTEAALCAAAAIVFNAFVLPRVLGAQLIRPHEAGAGVASGIVLYPVSVLLLIVVFAGRPDLAAAAWGILAVGDGVATLAGRRFGRVTGPWPWNPEKSYAGSAAFLLGGGLAAWGLMWWTAPALSSAQPWWMLHIAPWVAAGVAMLGESMPGGLDDNVSVPIAAGGTLGAFALVDPAAATAAWPVFVGRLPAALIVNGAVAAVSWKLGTVSRSGVIAGLVVGLSVWTGGGPAAWTLLLATFIVASASSRLGLKRKQVLGIAQEREGRRGAGNALANCLLAAVAAIVGPLSLHSAGASLVLVAALVVSASDTAASEVGKALGRATWSPTTLRRVAPGEIGGMSIEGTAAGLATAAALAALAAALGLVSSGTIGVLVVAAAVAMLVESVLGATLETRGVLDNDMLNFIDTLVASLVALVLARWWLA